MKNIPVDLNIHFSQGIKVTDLVLPVNTLPPSLENYEIAVLTDFHYGCYTNPKIIKTVIDIVNERDPKLILCLGDYVHSGRQELKLAIAKILGLRRSKYRQYRRSALRYAKELAKILDQLRPKDGMFSVWGNHDYIEGTWILHASLPKHLVHLNNDSVEVIVDPTDSRSCIKIFGIDDYRYGNPDFSIINNDANSYPIKILLSHNPDFVLLPDAAAIQNFSILLSGHTHGGQVCLPGGRPIKTETHQRNFFSGYYEFGGSPFYIANGIGCSGLPLRLYCPPEIVFLNFKNV